MSKNTTTPGAYLAERKRIEEKRQEIAEYTVTFKDRLAELIVNTSGDELRTRIGITRTLFLSYAHGDAYPELDHLIAMAEAGNVNIEWLATGIGPKMRGDGVLAESDPAPAPGHTVEELLDVIVDKQQRTLAAMNQTTGEPFRRHLENFGNLSVAYQVVNAYLSQVGS